VLGGLPLEDRSVHERVTDLHWSSNGKEGVTICGRSDYRRYRMATEVWLERLR
jgi:hypothetical protein